MAKKPAARKGKVAAATGTAVGAARNADDRTARVEDAMRRAVLEGYEAGEADDPDKLRARQLKARKEALGE